jgi:hypothetical protein
MSVDTIQINVEKMFRLGLSIESMFILDCIHKEDENLLVEYVRNCGVMDRSIFITLMEKSYIEKFDGDIIFNKLKLTPKALVDLGYSKLDHARFFKELRETYPKKVGKRPLQTDLAGCAKKYKSIVKSEEEHNLILNCVKLYVKDLKDDGRLQYIQLLPTWLNQRNFESYLDEARNIDKIEEDTYNQI